MDNVAKLKEWGGYLEACRTNDELTAKAIELDAVRYAMNEQGERILTDTEYSVLVGLGKQRRAELSGERNG